ncbi:MAG TPA: nitroreductase family protein [Candidatus Binatia bacterium]|nr:nitroreductase family protein [Candidatus Binatia bacterium]
MNLNEIFVMRRAYRSLQPVKINEELVRELATAASLSASCFNNQPWRFVFVYETDVLDKVKAAMNKGNRWTSAASLIIAVCSRRDLDCLVKEREYFLFDTGMATAFLILRAAEMGLVAHPIAGYDEEKVKEALAIPADLTVITLVNVGKHLLPPNDLLSEQQKEIEKTRPERKPLSEIMRLNRY